MARGAYRGGSGPVGPPPPIGSAYIQRDTRPIRTYQALMKRLEDEGWRIEPGPDDRVEVRSPDGYDVLTVTRRVLDR